MSDIRLVNQVELIFLRLDTGPLHGQPELLLGIDKITGVQLGEPAHGSKCGQAIVALVHQPRVAYPIVDFQSGGEPVIGLPVQAQTVIDIVGAQVFLGVADTNAVTQWPRTVAAPGEIVGQAMRYLESAVAAAQPVINAWWEVAEIGIQLGVVLKGQVLAKKQPQPHRATLSIPLIDHHHAALTAAVAREAGLGDTQAIIEHVVIVALHITDVVDVQPVVQKSAGEGMIDAARGAVVQIKETALAGHVIHITVQQLTVKHPAGVTREPGHIDTVDRGFAVRVLQTGADPADAATATATGVFVQQAADGKVTPLCLQVHPRAIGGGATNHGVVLAGQQRAVAPVALRPGDLHRAQQLSRGIALGDAGLNTGRNIKIGRRANTAGIEHGSGPERTAAGAWRGGKDFLTFEEKSALLGKEGFKGTQIDNNVVGLHGAEVRVQRGRQLGIGVGTPVQIRADPTFGLAGDVVMGGGRIRIEGELRAGTDPLQLEGLEGRQVLRIGAWQGGP